jgi:hypothetical protein
MTTNLIAMLKRLELYKDGTNAEILTGLFRLKKH